MKAKLKVGKVELELEGDTQAELFREIASAEEVFGETHCSLCGCDNIRFVVRENSEGEPFHEFHCTKCPARLSLGQNRKGGGLFPIRKLIPSGPDAGKPSRELGTYGQHNGWTKYKGRPKTADGQSQGGPTTPPPQAKPPAKGKDTSF